MPYSSHFPTTATYNTSQKLWEQSPFPNYQCPLQVSETVCWHKLRCCYSTKMLQHWVGERGLIYFGKVDHSRISRKFCRCWLGFNNLCEILSQNLRKVDKQNGQLFAFPNNFYKAFGVHIACLKVVIPKLCHFINWEEWLSSINVILCNTLCE